MKGFEGTKRVDFRVLADLDFSIFGHATMRLTGILKSNATSFTIEARLAAFNDYYGFDPKKSGARSLVAEAMTRMFSAYDNQKGKPFDIAFIGDKFIVLHGNWDSIGADFDLPYPIPKI